MKLFIHIVSFCFSSSLCKYIYFSGCEVNFWIVNACTECVLGMYLQIGMYQECGIMGGSHFFFSYLVLLSCLFVCYLLGCSPDFLHLFFCTFAPHFTGEGEQFMQQYFKTKQTNKLLSDVKSPKPVKPEASMPKVMYIV